MSHSAWHMVGTQEEVAFGLFSLLCCKCTELLQLCTSVSQKRIYSTVSLSVFFLFCCLFLLFIYFTPGISFHTYIDSISSVPPSAPAYLPECSIPASVNEATWEVTPVSSENSPSCRQYFLASRFIDYHDDKEA